MGSSAIAVAKYTLIELSRRRLLLVFVLVAIVLTAALGIAPFILPGMTSADGRASFILGGISRVSGLAIELCLLAIGMTVISHDLDSGAIVAILAKPITRFSYAAGKLAGALFLLILLDALFTAGSMLVVALHGSGHAAVLFWFFATSSANAMLLMILVMVLTVYLNNIVAAAIVVVFSYVQGNVSILHAMVQNHVITDPILDPVINIIYWLFPHQLLSNLDRNMAITNFHVLCHDGCPHLPKPAQYLAQELARLPAASGLGDIVYWCAYLLVVSAILYFAIRRKEV
jgi:ABC-type transport system involved in multi-copper enzyme maturation permease subunit